MHMLTALCKLHNNCIDEKEDTVAGKAPEDVRSMFTTGGLLLPRIDGDDDTLWNYNKQDDPLTGQLDGGEHGKDYNQQQHISQLGCEEHLPYKVLLLNHAFSTRT